MKYVSLAQKKIEISLLSMHILQLLEFYIMLVKKHPVSFEPLELFTIFCDCFIVKEYFDHKNAFLTSNSYRKYPNMTKNE